jgi:hypothetical protein
MTAFVGGRVALAGGLLLAGACVGDDGPAAAFERLYAASAQKDPTRLRAALCAPLQAALAPVKDDELVAALRVRRVVRRVDVVKRETQGSVTTAVLRVEDTQGQHQEVLVQRAGGGAWCVASLEEPAK